VSSHGSTEKVRMKRKISRDSSKIIHKDEGNGEEEIDNGDSKKKTRTSDDGKVSTKEERDRFHNNLYRPPTADELNELRETEDLFQNNLFRMQISYLLDEVKLCNKKTKSIEDFLHLLYKFLNDLEPTEKHDISICLGFQKIPNFQFQIFHLETLRENFSLQSHLQ